MVLAALLVIGAEFGVRRLGLRRGAAQEAALAGSFLHTMFFTNSSSENHRDQWHCRVSVLRGVDGPSVCDAGLCVSAVKGDKCSAIYFTGAVQGCHLIVLEGLSDRASKIIMINGIAESQFFVGGGFAFVMPVFALNAVKGDKCLVTNFRAVLGCRFIVLEDFFPEATAGPTSTRFLMRRIALLVSSTVVFSPWLGCAVLAELS